MKFLEKAYLIINGTVNLASTAIGVFAVISLASGEKIEDSLRPAIWFIIALATFFLMNNFYLRWRLSKHNLKYAEGYGELNLGFARLHELHNLDLKNGEDDHHKSRVYNGLRYLATHMSNLFTNVKGSPCPVCIKILKADEEVDTICRDSRSESTRSKVKNDGPHKVQNNTDFERILANMDDTDKRYYLGINLPSKNSYKNSSIKSPSKYYAEEGDNNFEKISKYLNRRLNWPLKYKSTLVVPIFPLIKESDENNSQPIGFLCVDSRFKRTFNHGYDLDIMRGVADGLYYYLKDFKPLL